MKADGTDRETDRESRKLPAIFLCQKTFERIIRMRKYQAFSLIEVIITIGILLILVAVVTPQFIGYLNRSKSARAMMEMQSLRTALQSYYADWGEYPSNLDSLKGSDESDLNSTGNFTITGVQGPIDYFEKDLPQDVFWKEGAKNYKYLSSSTGNQAVLWSNGINKTGLIATKITWTSGKISIETGDEAGQRDSDDLVVEI
jgi:prepilin-type N-terminal cleavage/methylation domain-containing protein